MSTPLGYFEGLYAADPDPWSFTTRWYDARKHALTAGSLPRRRYRSGFEPGCSIGMLTALLGERCDRLLAVDAVPEAVAAAAERVAGQDHITVRAAAMPRDWPDGSFDLVVLSELGYYFDDADLSEMIARAVSSLEPGGDLVAVHWRWPVAEHARSGDDVHARLAATDGLARLARHEEADFLLEVFTRVPTAPGAEAPGAEAPGAEAPGSEAPGSEAPGAEAPGSEVAGSGQPGTGAARSVAQREGLV